MSETVSDNSKTISIIAYLTLIGWIIALIMHSNEKEKSELAAFHIRQFLGIMLLSLIFTLLITFLGIPILDWIIQIGLLALWIIGFLGAIQGEMKAIPIFGDHFQKWFAGIG